MIHTNTPGVSMNKPRNRQTIEQFIVQCLEDEDKDEKCSHFVLVHVQGHHQIELHSKKVQINFDVPAAAKLFESKAEVYAQDLPGAQTYNLLAFFSKEEPESRFVFIKSGEQFHEGLATEEATPKGERQQSMRHLEAGMQLVFRQNHLMFGMMEKALERMETREERLIQENNEAHLIVRDVIMQQVTNAHTLEMKRLEFERSTLERKALMALAPALANSILGTEVFPQSTEDTSLVEGIIDAFDNVEEDKGNEAMSALSKVLPPTLFAPLMSRMQKHAERKKSETKALKAASQASTLEGEEVE